MRIADALRLQRDRHRRDDERRLHLVRDERFLDLGEALEHPRDEELAGLGELRDVVGHRAGEVAGHRDVGDVELPLVGRDEVVREDRPVHVEDGVQRRDDDEPRGDAERAMRFGAGHADSPWKPQRTARSLSSRRASDVEREADDADEEHAGDDEVVALARVARVDDEVAEPGVDGDHLGGHDDEPRDAERDPQAHEDLRAARRGTRPARGAAASRARSCGPACRYIEGTLRTPFIEATTIGKNAPRKMRKPGAASETPNQQDRERHPRERADRAHHLDDRVERRGERGCQPSARPAGMPRTSARRYPDATRRSESPT